MIVLIVFSLVSSTICASVTESYKDQFCTDPRTMKQHAAYTEWADAYSCTRHRCQPGGRNLAIYTVGCKRVEAPESAIECEEVVEDTNMQFPYCCTRLRCLVVVRGEVWTRVLGQPWEALPAAPWSHMYKMKRPPPSAGTFLPKTPAGPIYELADSEKQKVMRASKPDPDCEAPAAPAPDIVIALSTSTDEKDDYKKTEVGRRQMPSYRRQYRTTSSPYDEAEREADTALDLDDNKTTEKAPPANQRADNELSDEKMFPNSFDTPTEKDPTKETPASNLQALVDAIGSRMRDIETVVQRMSDKVHDEPVLGSEEKRLAEGDADNHKLKTEPKEQQAKQPASDSEYYKRFTVRSHGSKYLHTSEATTEAPLFVEDTNTNSGYFSDASNSVLRRPKLPKEPAETYMAPVDTRRKHESSDDTEKKHKKHTHKKKNKHGHKKRHGKDDKKRKLSKISSVEIDRNMVSLEDSSALKYQD